MTASKQNKTISKAVDSTLIRRLYQFLKPYNKFILLALGLTLVVSFLGPLRPYLIQVAVDDFIAPGDIPGLTRITLLIFAVLIAESVIMIGMTYITRWIGQGALLSLRNAVFKKIQSLHVQFFDKNPIGRLITRTTNDIEALSDLLSSGVVNIIGDLFRIFFILLFMFMMSWELTLVAISTLPILFYATFWFKAKVRVAFLEVRDWIARLNSFVQEHINGMSIVQLFGREVKEAEKFKKINQEHTGSHIRTIFYFAVFWPAVEVLSSLAMALVIWYGGASVLSGTLTFGILLAFIQYVRLFFLPIRDLSDKFNTLQSALASSERIFDVMDTPNHIIEKENAITVNPSTYDIEFKNVSFRYIPDGDQILKNVSFDVIQGQTVAVVGATGAGKSTLINLLTRFYDIKEGEILLGGKNIKEYSLKTLRKSFGLVLQDNALFSGSIAENISLGNEAITLEQIKEAAQAVEAHHFIERLPGGYNYVLHERGASLSMGQRQLLCFVRAMVYNPSILILDEATSNVDSETESMVNKAIDQLMKDRTSIVIAHRLATIQHADKIIVMHKGEIREVGTHQQLLRKKGGIYRKLYELQYKDQAA
ncbi:MAG: ABC transporter ATP-binding protein/permease [Balneolia bacterium]|nr:ABC transporter ATP-binding protein/permease [Balneolia bacterium]